LSIKKKNTRIQLQDESKEVHIEMVDCNSEETKAEEKEELLSLRCELEKKLPEVEKELHRGRRELSIWQTFPLKLRTVGVSNIL
jgi:hypothetical protein